MIKHCEMTIPKIMDKYLQIGDVLHVRSMSIYHMTIFFSFVIRSLPQRSLLYSNASSLHFVYHPLHWALPWILWTISDSPLLLLFIQYILDLLGDTLCIAAWICKKKHEFFIFVRIGYYTIDSRYNVQKNTEYSKNKLDFWKLWKNRNKTK